MIRTQSIFLGSWTTVHREHSFGNQGHVAHSELLVCPRCHSVWGKLLFNDEQAAWAVAASCEACNFSHPFHPVPGSILTEEGFGVIDDSLLAKLPEALLRREFDLHMKAYANATIVQSNQTDLFKGL